MKILINLILATSFLFIVSCNKDVTIIGSKKVSFWHVPSTLVLNKGIQFANGLSQLVIKLQVFDTNNQPIEGMFLRGNTASTNVNFINCTQTNSQGVTYCFFTATVAGTYNIDFTDGVEIFPEDIIFINLPTRLEVVRVSNTAVLRQNASGYTVTTGLRKTSWLKNTPLGYEVDTEAPVFKLNLTSP